MGYAAFYLSVSWKTVQFCNGSFVTMSRGVSIESQGWFIHTSHIPTFLYMKKCYWEKKKKVCIYIDGRCLCKPVSPPASIAIALLHLFILWWIQIERKQLTLIFFNVLPNSEGHLFPSAHLNLFTEIPYFQTLIFSRDYLL